MYEESESCVTNSDSADSGITDPRVSRILTNPKRNTCNVDIKITEPKETRPESLDRLLHICVKKTTDPDHSHIIDSTNNKHSTGKNVAVQRFKENMKESRCGPTRTIATATGLPTWELLELILMKHLNLKTFTTCMNGPLVLFILILVEIFAGMICVNISG